MASSHIPTRSTSRVIIILSFLLFGYVPLCAEESYSQTITSIREMQHSFNREFRAAKSKSVKDSLIKKAKTYLIKTLSEEIFPAWYGTKWEFYGRTTTPQKGSIACGYFVTHTLSDLGFNIPKTSWAQLASEAFIKKLSTSPLKRFSNASMEKVEYYLRSQKEGVYLVGLDCHVGFVLVTKEDIRFIHSSYYHPHIGVMSESIKSTNPLSDSSYRVFGKLFSSQMVKNWILKNRYH